MEQRLSCSLLSLGGKITIHKVFPGQLHNYNCKCFEAAFVEYPLCARHVKTP